MSKHQPEDTRRLTITDIVNEGLLQPYAKSHPGVRELINKDRAKRDLLEPTITGTGNNRRYYIRMHNLRKFVKALESGKYRI